MFTLSHEICAHLMAAQRLELQQMAIFFYLQTLLSLCYCSCKKDGMELTLENDTWHSRSILSPIISKCIGDDIVSTDNLAGSWQGSATNNECTLHQLSPYIGKMKSSMAKSLVLKYSKPGQTIYDPFCGSGTIALEAWSCGRTPVANDLSPYANILTRAKLFPPQSLADAFEDIAHAELAVGQSRQNVDLRTIPKWVRSFYHPETLRETVAWFKVLRSMDSPFLTACLLGILHHQRPGFLSYPSSHTTPYLRTRMFPKEQYPELYAYRSVRDRLERKVKRSFKRVPELDYQIPREYHCENASSHVPGIPIDAIITSPPYMRQLDYARDNRLRLWFLGETDWRSLEGRVSPSKSDFIQMMYSCFETWCDVLQPGGECVLVVGDSHNGKCNLTLPNLLTKMACEQVKGYSLVDSYAEMIPDERRARRGYQGSQSETVLILKRICE